MTDSHDEIDLHELQIDTLSGDVRDAMLMQYRNRERPWSMLVEHEQRQVAELFDKVARNLVRQAINLLADYPWPVVEVTLGEVKVKGHGKGVEGKITCQNREEDRNVLTAHVDERVIMVMVDSETFMAERHPVDIQPDQRELAAE